MRRLLSSARTAPTYLVPLSLLEFKFVRSQGPGGQAVNKVSSAAECRVKVDDLDLPEPVLLRLVEQERNKINLKRELVVHCQDDRSQLQNKNKCISRIQAMVDLAFVEPKLRVVQTAPPEKTKEKWRQEKAHRSQLKQGRSNRFDD